MFQTQRTVNHHLYYIYIYTCWILTGYARRIRILVRVLHVLHERLAAQEQFMADGAGRGVRAADQGGMLLQNAQMQLQFLKRYRNHID